MVIGVTALLGTLAPCARRTPACHKTCQNGGSCKRTQRGDRFQCTCKPGYLGKLCEKTRNRCNPNPCANGGLCRPLHNDFSCACKDGHASKRCENHVLTEKELDKKLDSKFGTVVNAIKESGQCKCHQHFMMFAMYTASRAVPYKVQTNQTGVLLAGDP